MLKKQNRLKSNRAFNATYNNNHSVFDKSVILYLGQEKKDINCPTRVGFVVSKKIHKRAVKRNRIKRLMREVIRLKIKENSLPDNYQSAILNAKKAILDKNFNEIKLIIENLFQKTANKNI